MGNLTTLQILQGVHDWVLDKIDEETANFITKTVNDLVNYYTKSETYTKVEVQQIVDAIKQFTYEVVQVLPTASASTMNKIYLVPAPKSEDKNVKEEYITIQNGSTYTWEMLGTTSIDLSNYYTKGQTDTAITNALNTALANYTTTADLNTLLNGKQNTLTFDDEPTEDSANPVKSGGIWTAIKNAVNAVKEWANSKFAKFDGYYKTMGVGLADNLISPDGVTNTEPYIFRTSAGYTSIGKGYAQLKKIEGRTVKWNQLQKTITGIQKNEKGVTFEITNSGRTIKAVVTNVTAQSYAYSGSLNLIEGHVYLSRGCPKGGSLSTYFATNARYPSYGFDYGNGYIFTAISGNLMYACDFVIDTNTVAGTYEYNPQLIDLTDIFGAGNEPETVEEFEAWLAQNVGMKSYYPYTAGTLVSVDVDGLETTGFNQWDEEWEVGYYHRATDGAKMASQNNATNKNAVKIFPSTDYYLYCTEADSSAIYIVFYDAGGNFLTYTSLNSSGGAFTTPTEAAYMYFNTSKAFVDAGKKININISWSGYRNGEYEEYWKEKLNLSWIKTLKDSNDNILFPYGLLSAGSIKDEVTPTKAIKRIGVVDLGSLTWNYNNSVFYTSVPISDIKKPAYDGIVAGIICSKYTRSTINDIANGNIACSSQGFIQVKDNTYSDASTFKAAMNGVMLYYALAEPIEVDIEPEANMNYKVDDFGTEEFTSDSENVPQTVAPYHTTHYMDNLRDKLRNIDVNFVAATQEQSFTDAEKSQARQNIGAGTVNANDNCPNLTSGLSKNLIDTYGVGSEQEFVFRPTGGGTAISGNGNVTIQKFKGKSLAWNQIAPLPTFTSEASATDGSQVINNNDGTVTVKVTSAPAAQRMINVSSVSLISGHKYCVPMGISDKVINFVATQGNNIFTANVTGNRNFQIAIAASIPVGNYTLDIVCIDLTLMFGAGNEPATVAEFEALFPNIYYTYNVGTIINNEVKQIETTGRNVWDEEWEEGIINSSGIPESGENYIRSKNFINIISGVDYYFARLDSNDLYGLRVVFYDANKNQVYKAYCNRSIISSPNNAAYCKFFTSQVYGSTYNHDICINLSDASFNGTYEAYRKNTISINLDRFDVKDGEGNVITVNGLKSAGTVYDEIDTVRKKYIKRVESVDLGTLGFSVMSGHTHSFINTNAEFTQALSGMSSKYTFAGNITINDNSADKTFAFPSSGTLGLRFHDSALSGSDRDANNKFPSLSGIILNYELITPIEYDLVTPIQNIYPAPAGGTEGIVPQGVNESGVPTTAPFRGINFYSKDYVQTINNMPVDFDATASIDALASALATTLGTALNGTLTITRGAYDATNKKYAWTVSFNANT